MSSEYLNRHWILEQVAKFFDRLLDNIRKPFPSRVLICSRRAAPPPELSKSLLPKVECREILISDLEGIIDLLTIGFAPNRSRCFWVKAIRRLTEHATPAGLPKYGYLLESNGVPVGVLLLIFSSRLVGGDTRVRCNCSSLYVAPSFRSYAPFMINRAIRRKDITYLNLTAGPQTWPMLEAQGYKPFSSGVYMTIPALCYPLSNIRIRAATAETCRDTPLQPFEVDMLLAHSNYECVCVLCEFGGNTYPFIFAISRKYGLPVAHLIYCRNRKDFILLAGSLGRFLIKRGLLWTFLDANGPIPGLTGLYRANRPKFSRGPNPPQLGDLPYTERVMFGF